MTRITSLCGIVVEFHGVVNSSIFIGDTSSVKSSIVVVIYIPIDVNVNVNVGIDINIRTRNP